MGLAVSIPLTLVLKPQKQLKFVPMLLGGSIGTIADYAMAWQDTWPARKLLYDTDRELATRSNSTR